MLSGNSLLLHYDVYGLGLHDLMSISTSNTVTLVTDLAHDSNASKCKLSIRPLPFLAIAKLRAAICRFRGHWALSLSWNGDAVMFERMLIVIRQLRDVVSLGTKQYLRTTLDTWHIKPVQATSSVPRDTLPNETTHDGSHASAFQKCNFFVRGCP